MTRKASKRQSCTYEMDRNDTNPKRQRGMSQPLYRFGQVRAGENLRGPLEPPEQADADCWQAESDIGLSFDSFGEGHPVLVVHGGPGIPYGNAWKGLDALTDQYQFDYYHQRGCGNSTRPFDRFEGGNFYDNMIELERTLGLGTQIADIERIRQILGREKITLIGHSFGGFIATLYAAEFPNRVDRLILVAPAGVLPPPDEERNLFDVARTRLDGPAKRISREPMPEGSWIRYAPVRLSDGTLRLRHSIDRRKLPPERVYVMWSWRLTEEEATSPVTIEGAAGPWVWQKDALAGYFINNWIAPEEFKIGVTEFRPNGPLYY